MTTLFRRSLADLLLATVLLSTAWLAAGPVQAAEQVIVPEVERRPVTLPRYPSNDFTVGLFAGGYSTQNFGSSTVTGLRLGYHITEDFFAEASIGRAKVTDESFRQVLPGGIFVKPEQTLAYYNAVAGWNVLPGEVFFGRKHARAYQGYIVAGVGSTKLAEQRQQTLTAGFGLRVVMTDWFIAQADVRDHFFSLDLLGKRQRTQNPEITLGLTVSF